jgi:hypothetical protein
MKMKHMNEVQGVKKLWEESNTLKAYPVTRLLDKLIDKTNGLYH